MALVENYLSVNSEAIRWAAVNDSIIDFAAMLIFNRAHT